MCGIVGFTGKKNIRSLETIIKIIEHRGRDGNALDYVEGIHLGMNRLAIRDLTKNLYPMRYKQYVVIFNGEIYNFKELKEQLLEKNISLKTRCDAEVILPLFDIYGLDFLSMLEGMFAFCIVDVAKNQVLLVRDRFGEKPLYYFCQNGIFGFASEIKVVLRMINARTVIRDSVNHYLSRGYIHGRHTLLHHVNKLEPSHYLLYDLKKKITDIGVYWKPKIYSNRQKLYSETSDETRLIATLDTLIERSVGQRLLSDVPVGLFLSGGVDSSLIGHYATQRKRNLKSYSIRFIGSSTHDESEFSDFASKQMSTDHTEIECTPEQCKPFLSEIGKYIDDPISDPAVLPTLLMSEVARTSVKVVLTGDGADELFAGYERYGRQLLVEKVRNQKFLYDVVSMIHYFLPHKFSKILLTLPDRYHTQSIWARLEIEQLTNRTAVLLSQLYRSDCVGKNPLLAMQLSDLEGYLSEQLLMKVDKSTMAHNLEARAPYLDSGLAEFALNLPNEYKVRLGGKYILKKVAERYFPEWFVFRPKHGFSVPLKYWFCKEYRDNVLESVDDISKYAPSFNNKYYGKIVNDHIERRSDNTDKIWSMLVLGSWLKYHEIYL